MKLRIIFSLFIGTIFLLISQGRAGASDGGVEVTFRVATCPKYAGTPPMISVATRPSSQPVNLDVTPTFAAGVWTFVTSLAPNTYIMSGVGGLYCVFNGAITIIPDHKRTIPVVLGPSLLLSEATDSLAGVLPLDGLGVSLVSKSGKEIAAVVENRAYYFELLRDGMYTLKVLVQNKDYVEIPVEVHGSLTRRDVKLNEILSPTSL